MWKKWMSWLEEVNKKIEVRCAIDPSIVIKPQWGGSCKACPNVSKCLGI